MWHALVTIFKEEGFYGYLRGNGTNIIRIFPYSAVQFAAYEQFKKVRRSSFRVALLLSLVVSSHRRFLLCGCTSC